MAQNETLLGKRLPLPGKEPHEEELLVAFLGYAEERGLELYPAQEEAILELFSGNNVILNTPTGSGKSLVALAACFKALSEGRTAVYTAPIKALVTEKFFELCQVLGKDEVGMMTGDATVNPDAKVICCTAEILSNRALRLGEHTPADWVVMDEFHYYSDRDRGAAWQIPLITLPHARFLLMSATLGEVEFFQKELERTTNAPCKWVRSVERPVPLDFAYGQKPLQQTVMELCEQGKVPVYIVHFSQRAASEQAQKLMSLDFLSKEAKDRIKQELVGFRFDSPFGKELSRFVRHGVGVHHAGMLPKYRRLCERLAQQGLLLVICGTDTLGVGVNVPIRTVLFTQLCKFDGKGTTLLSVRDFHQIAGRAGRRGFDTQGSVVVQAPEHEIENLQLKAKAEGDPKKTKKLRLKQPPDRGYKPWNETTMKTLMTSSPEPLVSRFGVDHAMVLNVLSGARGCKRAREIVMGSHENQRTKRRLMREGAVLVRSLVEADIVEFDGGGVVVNADLQLDFSLNQALGLYAVEAIAALDTEASDYAMVLLSVVEAILETPSVILQKQVDELKRKKVFELKAAGVEYDQRMEELEKIEAPKPEAEFIYETYNLFAKTHVWVSAHPIAPKSIVRDMFELAASFNDYVKEYGLARAEGVLLRYLTDAYRALRQTVPESAKTEDVIDLIEWLGVELRSVDASLLEEWEQLEQGLAKGELPATPTEPKPIDITQNRRAFFILVRNASFRFTTQLARRDADAAVAVLASLCPDGVSYPQNADGEVWTAARLAQAIAPYWEQYESMVLDQDARSAKRIDIEPKGDELRVRQTLSDPENDLEWAAYFRVDLPASREQNRVVMQLLSLGNDVG